MSWFYLQPLANDIRVRHISPSPVRRSDLVV
jgi:hypothetical protein